MSGPDNRDIRVVRAGLPKLDSRPDPVSRDYNIRKNSLSNFREVSSLVFANSFQIRSSPATARGGSRQTPCTSLNKLKKEKRSRMREEITIM